MTFVRFCTLLVLMHSAVAQALSLPPVQVLPPKSEVRAVWVTTAAALDWPHVAGRTRQQESLRRMVHELHAARFNTIIFQVRPRGDALYRSRYEPWAEALSGTLGGDPGWDPCAFILAEAHALGMEVHGWFNAFKIRGPNPVGSSTPEHPSRAYPEWCVVRGEEVWLDPGRPEVRSYVLNVALDLIRHYDLDGINFDFIRYPGQDFPDGESFARYGRGMKRDDWRRANITAFVRSFATEAATIAPALKIGASPFGVYRDESNNDLRGSYYWVYQDSYAWLTNKWMDYLSPQIYWKIGRSNGDPDFRQAIKRWSEQTAGRHVYMGIGAYRPDIRARLGEYVDSCRTVGSAGHAFFRWEDIADARNLAGRYPTWALIPPMRWKDATPPLTPLNLRVTTPDSSVRNLEWEAPPAAHDGDTARTYVVYRWISRFIPFSNPWTIAAILPSTQRRFTDTLGSGTGNEYFYAISACDRMWNESPPSAVVSSRPAPAPTAPKPHQPSNISLSVALANKTGYPLTVLYNLTLNTRVALDLFLRRDGEADSLHTRLVRAVQDGGLYRVRLDSIRFTPGTYVMRLTTTEATIEQTVVVR